MAQQAGAFVEKRDYGAGVVRKDLLKHLETAGLQQTP